MRIFPWVVTAVVILYAAVAAALILVVDPLAAVRGSSLGEVYVEVEAAGESTDAWSTVLILAIGPLAMSVLLAVRQRGGVSNRVVTTTGLALIAIGPIAYWYASFGPGMALADAYGISGGDHHPWGWGLLAVSAVAAVALLAAAAQAGRSPARTQPVGHSN